MPKTTSSRNQRNNPYLIEQAFAPFHTTMAGAAWRCRTELATITILTAALWRLPTAASRRSAPPPPRSSDADTTPGAATGPPARPALLGIPAQPPMHRLPRHPLPAGHLGHRNAVVQDLQHRAIPLLHRTQLHQHTRQQPRPLMDRSEATGMPQSP